ncbi:hypothetical protein HanPSC8_Chr16g0698331 [Helianthus annuus]|nr:hypothetical protein HanPSC8_Chr16g0698331 [Helianthus annuus]
MSFFERSGLAFLLALIKCSPNLERIELEMKWGSYGSAVKDEYSDVWLEHLKELHICFRGNSDEMKSVMEFVKFILVRSPKLNKVTVFSTAEYYRESVIVKTLLGAPRASPAVIITLNEFDISYLRFGSCFRNNYQLLLFIPFICSVPNSQTSFGLLY